MKKYVILTIVIGVLLAGTAFAGGQQEAEPSQGGGEAQAPVEISLWHQEQPPERQQRFQEVIDAFNAQSPNVTVTQTVQSWGEAFTKTVGALQAGRGPDILFAIPGFAANIKMAAGDSVQPVDDIVAAIDSQHSYIDAATRPYFWDDHYWAVPLFGQVHLLYYNKAVYREAGLDPDAPPETWAELEEDITTFIDGGVTPYGIGVSASDTLAGDQFIYSLLASNDAEYIFDEDGNIIFDNPNTVETYEFWGELYENSPPGSLNYRWIEPQTAMFNGQTAFAFVLGGMLSNWDEQSGMPPEDLGAAFIPTGEGADEGAIYYSNAAMVLTDDPAKQEAISDFLQYLHESETYGRFLTADPGLFLPVTATGEESDTFWNDPVITRYRDLVELQIEQSAYGKLPGFNRDTFNPAIGRISGQNILAKVAQKIAIDGWDAARAVEWGADQMEAAGE